MADKEVDRIEEVDESKSFMHLDGVGDRTQKALDALGSHQAVMDHQDLKGYFKSNNINHLNDVKIEEIQKHAKDQFERERKAQQQLTDEAKRQKEERLEANKGRFVGGAQYAANKTKQKVVDVGKAIKRSPETIKQAGRDAIERGKEKASDVRNNFWSYAGKTAVGGAKGTGKLLKGTGKLALGTAALGLSVGKGIKDGVEGEQHGKLNWLIWVGIIVHLLYWKVFDFNHLDPTYIMLNYFIVFIILLNNYNVTVLDRRKFGIFIGAYLFYRYLVPSFGPAYPWIFLVESLMIFIIVALLSDWWVAAAFFLQLGGINIFVKYLPWLNTGIGSFLFTKTPIWPPWWTIMSATVKTDSLAKHAVVAVYFSIIFLAVFQGSAGFMAATTIEKFGGEDVSKVAGIEFEQSTQNNWWNSNVERVGLCWNSYINPEKGKRDACSKLGMPPDKLDDEDELYRSKIDKSMQEQVTMEWFTEKNTMSVGESAFMSANLYVVSLYDDIGVDIGCGSKNDVNIENANPSYTKISSGIMGKEKTINCDIPKESLKEGNNRIEFVASVVGSQLDIESKFVFYTIEQDYLDGKEQDYLNDPDNVFLYQQERKNFGLTQAKLNLYEQRLLPEIIQNMKEKIRNDYKYYPSEKIGSRSEPGFVKVNINLNNNIPFVGIKKDTKIPVMISLENMFEDGKILSVDSGVIVLPLWLEPSNNCEILDKDTEKTSGSEHSYNIKNVYLSIDWTSYDYGFKNRKKFKSCEFNVNKDTSDIEGFYFNDLNMVEIGVVFDFDYEMTTSNILYVEKGALDAIA